MYCSPWKIEYLEVPKQSRDAVRKKQPWFVEKWFLTPWQPRLLFHCILFSIYWDGDVVATKTSSRKNSEKLITGRQKMCTMLRSLHMRDTISKNENVIILFFYNKHFFICSQILWTVQKKMFFFYFRNFTLRTHGDYSIFCLFRS